MANSRKSLLKKLGVLFIFALALILLYMIYYSGLLGLADKIVLFAVVLMFSGISIQKLINAKGGFGAYLIDTKKGIGLIEKLSKKFDRFWENMPIWGIILALGLFSYFFLGKKASKKMYIFGMLSIIVIMSFVLPYLSYSITFINLPQVTGRAAASAASSTGGVSPLYYVVYGLTFIFGFTGYTISLIWYNGFSIISALSTSVLSIASGTPNYSSLANQIPGVAPIIPGIDIPFFAGILSLILIMTIHEFSHGILAKRFKLSIKSIGMMLFGIVPIGAFVEPDEKKLQKLDSIKQMKIFSAGFSINIVATIVFVALLILMITYVYPTLYQQSVYISSVVSGYPANGILSQGMQILYWNGYPIHNIANFTIAAKNDTAGSIINVVTNTGTYHIKAVSSGVGNRGLIGIDINQPLKTGLYVNSMLFIYSFIALSFMLNFLIAIVNMLPLPGLDGWRIYKLRIKNKRVFQLIYIIIGVGLILNILPWFF